MTRFILYEKKFKILLRLQENYLKNFLLGQTRDLFYSEAFSVMFLIYPSSTFYYTGFYFYTLCLQTVFSYFWRQMQLF